MAHPAVRSIQIAAALIDRLAELLRAPKGTAPMLSLLAGTDVVRDSLELRLGEAQQISPEVWRHLDDAREVLAARGKDTSEYDELRKMTNPAGLATTDIHVQNRLSYYGLATMSITVVTEKSVRWDTGNLVSGIAACAALKKLLSEVDWVALDREDREQIAAAGSLATAKWRGAAKALVLVIALVGVVVGAYFLFAGRDHDAAPRGPDDTALAKKDQEKVKAKLAELSSKYAANPCDKDVMRRYTAYLFADGRKREANEIEDKFAAECPAPPEPPAP